MGVAKFEKVSFEQFAKDMAKYAYNMAVNHGVATNFGELEEMYNNIKLPRRATDGSAGYDFYMPFDIHVYNHFSEGFPTGIRCRMNGDYVLMLFPRSGHGFKYGSRLKNTVGIIDSDYYFAENEGHIHCKLQADKPYSLSSGQSFMQGVFLQYGLTIDDDTEGIQRTGGFGSTDGTETI